MICDAHMHVGQFYGDYFSPQWVVDKIDEIGIDNAVVSSTTTCEENYDKVLAEIQTLCKLGYGKVLPVLWLTPLMLKEQKVIDRFLHCGIGWRCVKIHGALHEGWFTTYSIAMKRTIQIAKRLGVPLLMHTGEYECCEAGYYEKVISAHKRQTFILAHSRPVVQTIEVMKSCPNAWCDTAFSLTEEIVQLVDAGLSDRILWGTDLPIPSHFYGSDMDYSEYYRHLLKDLQRRITSEDYTKITQDNFLRLFKIQR